MAAVTNQEIQDIWSEYKPKNVERLDEAPCNAIFERAGLPTKVIDDLKV